MLTLVAVGAVFGPVEYSMRRRGAPAGARSYACATRRPVPVKMKASELPTFQPVRLTISCTIAVRLGVCWSGPACPTVVHAAGDQATALVVLGREEMFDVAVVKAAALSAACPLMVRDTTSDVRSSVWNCT